MSISQRLDLRQSQTLVMTPQLQQAIKLLQMSNQELDQFVETEVEQNPLLERPEEAAPEAPEMETFTGTSMADGANSTIAAPSTDERAPLSGSDDESATSNDDSVWEHDSSSSEEAFLPSHNNSFNDDDYSAANSVAEKPSLRDHLMEQVHVDIIDPVDRMIAAALVELLDDAGYLPADLVLVRTQLGVTHEKFESIIHNLQCFDPPGIFARSLKECLAIQLKEKNRLDPAMATLLDHLDLLAKRERNALMKLCGVDAEDLAEMIAEIRELNPKPAHIFTADVAPPIVPDVMLRQVGGAWQVELNNETLPRVLANTRYYAKVQEAAHTKIDKEYLSSHWQQANWLVKALQQRATTILKVASEIVKQQDSFFVHGVQHLKPLILRDIAAAVEMHESTVSRVTQNKYIATPRGLFELKYFFTTALGRSDGIEGSVSSESVRDRIRLLIEGESPAAILSDDTIADRLKADGVDIARRTVAKYREALRLPSSAQRRREKRQH